MSFHQQKCITWKNDVIICSICQGKNGVMNKYVTAEMKAGKGGINQAAMTHGGPKAQDMLSGHVEHGSNSGPDPYLNDDEEAELFTFLQECSSMHGLCMKI